MKFDEFIMKPKQFKLFFELKHKLKRKLSPFTNKILFFINLFNVLHEKKKFQIFSEQHTSFTSRVG